MERPEFRKSTRIHVHANFRTCHDSGITGLALAGVSVYRIKLCVGHDDVQAAPTSPGYVKEAEPLGATPGTFGPLPALLIAGSAVLESSNGSAEPLFP